MKVALVTYRRLPGLSADDQLLAAELDRRGSVAVPVVWDDAGVNWNEFDAIVVRSAWDYHVRLDEFRRWIEDRAAGPTPLFNSARVLQWNAEKTYLREVAERGIPVVPTRWVERGERTRLCDLVGETGWSEIVVKPVVSASAHLTWRATSPVSAADEQRFAEDLSSNGLMVQPLLPEVAREGELSVIFIGGWLSHVVRKRPKTGDFRVQAEHGGTAEREHADELVVDGATRALAAAPEVPLYARVDGCVIDGVFTLMELELLEPSLFFLADGEASALFADALASAVRRAVRSG
jgi:glutathione synthase/RimK-type ligase-like ATP-grasp enzyme